MNDFYVYAWLRPCGTPFYIGKGRGGRDRVPKIHNPLFLRIVRRIRSSGSEPQVVRICDGMNESDAFAMEMSLIAQYGRRDNNTGILANLTDGGEGRSGAIASECSRKKNAEAHRGRRRPPETGVRISAAKIGKPRPKSVGEAVRLARTGSKLTSAAIARRTETTRNSGARTNSLSGFKCVTPKREKWAAYIRINGKRTNLGTFPTPEEAARAYDRAAYAAWGADCYLNFPAEMAALRSGQ